MPGKRWAVHGDGASGETDDYQMASTWLFNMGNARLYKRIPDDQVQAELAQAAAYPAAELQMVFDKINGKIL